MTDKKVLDLWSKSATHIVSTLAGYTTQQHYFAALIIGEERLVGLFNLRG